ncbi:MAG: tetratricopeptide repeat protein [Caulobacterales bacterium]
MAESEDIREGEEAVALQSGAALAVGLAAAFSRRKSKAAGGDPELDAFLAEHTRLAQMQAEQMRETGELALSRLRWGRFSDRIKALLQMMTAVVGVGVMLLVGAMVWHAHEQHGLEIEAFSVPPDLARSGLTGQVAAGRFLDKLQALQTATENSDRPSESYEGNWGSDVKVEIPQTGLTFSDFEKLLRDRVGHVSRVTGEVLTTPTGIAVTARMGDAPPQTFTGPAGSFDDLAQKAAEAVYRASQPYRYAEYLDQHGRWEDAFAVVADLATHGPSSERGWAYSRWSIMDLNHHGDLAAARAHAAKGLGFGDGSDLSDNISLVNAEVWSGHDEAVLAISRTLDRETQKRLPDTSEFFYVENKLLGRAFLQFVEPDYPASAGTWVATAKQDTRSHFVALAPAMAATADALGHDLGAATALMRSAQVPAESTMIWDIEEGAFEALPTYWSAVERGDWAAALTDARAVDAALDAEKGKRPVYGLMQRVWIWPLEASALSHTGERAAAEALIGKTPLDCYLCVRVRGQIAADQKDWANADRWFAEAVRQAPSPPFAEAEWAQVRLARGDADGAIRLAKSAAVKGPRFADPLETWGQALMAKGDFAGASERFAAADKLAPHWPANHRRWGEALAKLGKADQARAQAQAAGRP